MEGAVRQYGSILAHEGAVFSPGSCLMLQKRPFSVDKGGVTSTKTYVTDIGSHTQEAWV